jgi:hypothetical protein
MAFREITRIHELEAQSAELMASLDDAISRLERILDDSTVDSSSQATSDSQTTTPLPMRDERPYDERLPATVVRTGYSYDLESDEDTIADDEWYSDDDIDSNEQFIIMRPPVNQPRPAQLLNVQFGSFRNGYTIR